MNHLISVYFPVPNLFPHLSTRALKMVTNIVHGLNVPKYFEFPATNAGQFFRQIQVSGHRLNEPYFNEKDDVFNYSNLALTEKYLQQQQAVQKMMPPDRQVS